MKNLAPNKIKQDCIKECKYAVQGAVSQEVASDLGFCILRDPKLSPEVQNDFLDYILEFERQIENVQTVTVRERIGNPPIQPVSEIASNEQEEVLDKLLDLLFEQGIVVDFMGEWDDIAAYRYITKELLDEEMDDIQIEGMIIHFDATTPEYDVQFWVEHFVQDVFVQEREYFLPGLEKQPLFDVSGRPISYAKFSHTGWDVVQTTLLDNLLAILS